MDDRICIGAVIYQLDYTVTPPKNKFYIIIGINEKDAILASVHINSNINTNVFPTESLRNLHLPIYSEDYTYLDHNSFVNCANLIVRSIKSVSDSLDSGGKVGYQGNINEDMLSRIIQLIKIAKTISLFEKKRFNLL